MNDDERKQKFITLLNKLLKDCGGKKMELAKRLNVKPSTLTPWFQGKIDPATIELAFFVRVAELNNSSTDELINQLGILKKSQNIRLDRFKTLIQDLLSNQTQEVLAKKLKVSEGAVSGWVRKQRTVDPLRISIATIAEIAREKNWTVEKLLVYLDLKQASDRENLSSKIKTETTILSLPEQIDLLVWLSNIIDQKIKKTDKIFDIEKQKFLHDQQSQSRSNLEEIREVARTLLIILEQENLAIASNYLQKLYVHTNINPENITITTIQELPDPIDSDILIFDISSSDSPSIALIQEISFDGDIVVFTSEDLPDNVRAGLEDRVTDVLVKPIDWNSLKDKEYFR